MSAEGKLQDEKIEEVLYLLRPRMRSLLARYRIPPADGEDLIQEAVLSALERRDAIENIEAWILTVLRFRCTVYQRRKICWKRLVQPMDPLELQTVAKPLAPPQEHRDICLDLKKLVSTVQPKELDILRMYFGKELRSREVALQMGCHPANVPKVLRRILSRLKIIATLPSRS